MTITGRGWALIPIFLWIIPVFFIPVRTATANASWYAFIICATSAAEANELSEQARAWFGT